jgi:hypothetical protein
MGMYDNIRCSYILPNPDAQNLYFQSKDLDCTLSDYEITKEGRLVKHCWEWEATPEDELPYKNEPKDSILRIFGCIRRKENSYRVIDQNYHGTLKFYGDKHTGELKAIDPETGEDKLHPGPEPEWFIYNAKFTDGKLVHIERIFED